MVYDNGVTDYEAPHNQDGAWNDYRMNEMWKWMRPSFKKIDLVDAQAPNNAQKMNSLLIKKVFQDIFVSKKIEPVRNTKVEDYLYLERIKKFFDLDHERFQNLEVNIGTQLDVIDKQDMEIITSNLSKLSFSDLNTTTNPWVEITSNINHQIKNSKKLTTSEIVELYQKQSPDSLFFKSFNKNKDLEEYLSGKTVAFVGPAPYLVGLNKGSLIDSYDVVVRIQHGIPNKQDYGSRTDIVQSCLNSNYGPPLVQHLVNLSDGDRPKFIICNDTASQLKPDGTWAFVDEVYNPIFEKLGIPFVHLRNNDETWDRWGLYWEIYAKEHIEKFSKGSYTVYSANFNSGYGALNMILGYPIKELAVFGVDFYNGGIPQIDKQKYNSQYTDTYGSSGTPNGPDKILHDQLSQMMHCKNVLLKDPRFILDKPVLTMLKHDKIDLRIKKFISLPKFKNETR
jgi:hypothetical protein